MEYFNTFGGNPVSCAVGMAVLDVLEAENLQDNARIVGDRLLAGLRGLVDRHAIAGDARGVGLYLGLELVVDRRTREPAAAAASHVANRMREHGILISTDGPDHNVLKIKPPICFSETDADRLVGTLDAVLAEDAVKSTVSRH
jgi:4-aminobutyrate aminotransferase-like enzyme